MVSIRVLYGPYQTAESCRLSDCLITRVNRQPSKELLELLNRKACVTHDPAHREGVDWIGTGERENAAPIGHDNVLAIRGRHGIQPFRAP